MNIPNPPPDECTNDGEGRPSQTIRVSANKNLRYIICMYIYIIHVSYIFIMCICINIYIYNTYILVSNGREMMGNAKLFAEQTRRRRVFL